MTVAKEAYVVHTVKDDKTDAACSSIWPTKAWRENEMSPSGNPDHSIMPKGDKIEDVMY